MQSSKVKAIVKVTVDRNKNAPKFENANSYKAVILENAKGGNEVFRFSVKDADQVVRYRRHSV